MQGDVLCHDLTAIPFQGDILHGESSAFMGNSGIFFCFAFGLVGGGVDCFIVGGGGLSGCGVTAVGPTLAACD